MEDFHPSVEMFDQRVAAFHPVAIVPIFDLSSFRAKAAEFGGVDMPANDPVDPAFGGGAGADLFIPAAYFDRVLDLVLVHFGQRPLRSSERRVGKSCVSTFRY